VPLGYYESVIEPGPDGRKRMYGWRYVGFVPYANCPIDACGSTTVCCQQSELYGLVSVGKKMYFRKLKDLGADVLLERSPVPPPTASKDSPPPGQKPKEPGKAESTSPAATTGYLVTPIPVDQMPKPKSADPPSPPREK
jgi:hypothetical protein